MTVYKPTAQLPRLPPLLPPPPVPTRGYQRGNWRDVYGIPDDAIRPGSNVGFVVRNGVKSITSVVRYGAVSQHEMT